MEPVFKKGASGFAVLLSVVPMAEVVRIEEPCAVRTLCTPETMMKLPDEPAAPQSPGPLGRGVTMVATTSTASISSSDIVNLIRPVLPGSRRT